MKKIALLSSNTNFFGNLEREFLNRNCEIQKLSYTNDVKYNYMQIGRLINWCDFVFVDFAQEPLPELLKYCGKPIVVRLHRIEVYNPQISSWDWSKVNLLIFIADHVKQIFEKKTKYNLKYPPQKTIVLKEGVDISKFTMPEIPRDYKLPLKIGMTGTVVPKKRFYTAIQLLYEIPDCELYIAGNYNNVFPGYGNIEYYENCLNLIEDLGLQDRVHFLGHVQDMNKFYQSIDIFLSMSNEEGYHASVMEAMACGCIPVVHNWRGAKDIYDKFVLSGFKELMDRLTRLPVICNTLGNELAKQCRYAILDERNAEELTKYSVDYILMEV